MTLAMSAWKRARPWAGAFLAAERRILAVRHSGEGNTLVRFLNPGLAIVILVLTVNAIFLAPAVSAQETDPVPIIGRSAIVIDATTGSILYEDNATERLAPASLTKIFTSYFAIETTPLQRRMTVEKADLVGEASAGLNAGDNLSFETLLHGLMLVSGNDSAMTIARNVGESQSPSALDGVASFMEYVNSRLRALGIVDTQLVNPHGLDENGHFSTARDIAAITMLALQTEPDFLRVVSSPGYNGEGYQFAQRNQLIGNYPGALGGKTGITDDAGYCLMGIAQRDGRTIISVVLGSTSDAWYSDVMALLDRGFATPTTTAQPVISLAPTAPSVSLASTSSGLEGMTVMAADAEAHRVTTASGATSWHVLRWPIGTVLAMIVALVCVIQGRALIELQKRPRARGLHPRRRPQRAPQRHVRPVLTNETQPFATLGSPRYTSHPIRTRDAWSGSVGD